LIARGEAPADCYVFALMRSGAGESRLGGERLAQSRVGLIRPGRDYEFHTTGRADLLLLAIPRHDAERSAQAIWGRSLEETDGRATIDFEKRDQHPGVVHAWSRVLSDMLASRTPVDDPATTSTLPDGLLVDLLCKVAPQGGRALSRRATAVRGAAFLRQQWRRPLCLRDVCEAVDAPERTLRQGFAEVYACSPMSYLRRIRLRTAREILLRSEPTERITDVALACGFTHMGSFSVDYRRTYGETPSETRAR